MSSILQIYLLRTCMYVCRTASIIRESAESCLLSAIVVYLLIINIITI